MEGQSKFDAFYDEILKNAKSAKNKMEYQSKFIDVCDKSLRNLKNIVEDVTDLQDYILFIAIKREKNETIENIPSINSPEIDKQILLHEQLYIGIGTMVDNGILYENIDPIIQNQYEKSLAKIPESKELYLQGFFGYLRQKLLQLCYIKIGNKNKTKLKKLRKLKKELQNVLSTQLVHVPVADIIEFKIQTILNGPIKERLNLFRQLKDDYYASAMTENIIDYYRTAKQEQLVDLEIYNMILHIKEVEIILKLKK